MNMNMKDGRGYSSLKTLGFVSGYRFSDTVSRSKSHAAFRGWAVVTCRSSCARRSATRANSRSSQKIFATKVYRTSRLWQDCQSSRPVP